MLPYQPHLKLFSRNLRKQMTDAEQVLWSRLRRKQILDVQFYRQKPIAGYIVDFYCPTARLVIELDGSQHHDAAHKIEDEIRDKTLATMGLLVLRFDNLQVLKEMEVVLAVIYRVVEERVGEA